MRRRQFLTTTAAAAATTTALASGVTAAGGSGRGEAPSNAPSATVNPFPNDTPTVSTGEWIEHVVGWIDLEGGDSTRADVEEFLTKTDTQAWIDGEPVADTESYWGEPVQNENGKWVVWWTYATPPKRPGRYSFRYRIEFTEALSEGDNPAGKVVDLTGHYEVSAGRGEEGGQGNGQ